MRRRELAILGFIVTGLASTPLTRATMLVTVANPTPACAAGQMGFSGTASDGGEQIRFWTCSRPDFCHSKIMKDTGEVISELLYENGLRRVWVGGDDDCGHGILYNVTNPPCVRKFVTAWKSMDDCISQKNKEPGAKPCGHGGEEPACDCCF